MHRVYSNVRALRLCGMVRHGAVLCERGGALSLSRFVPILRRRGSVNGTASVKSAGSASAAAAGAAETSAASIFFFPCQELRPSLGASTTTQSPGGCKVEMAAIVRLEAHFLHFGPQ